MPPSIHCTSARKYRQKQPDPETSLHLFFLQLLAAWYVHQIFGPYALRNYHCGSCKGSRFKGIIVPETAWVNILILQRIKDAIQPSAQC